MNGNELECKSLRLVVLVLATARMNQEETVELALAQKVISFEVHKYYYCTLKGSNNIIRQCYQ